jgi:hypothetical protein
MSGYHLSRHLLKLFGKGELSGTQVFDIAEAAWSDGWGRTDELARKLVRAGDGGRSRNHIARDIIAAAESMGLVSSSAAPYILDIATGGHVLLFLPHEFYPSMVQDLGIGKCCMSQETLDSGNGIARLLKDWAQHADVGCDLGELPAVGVLGMHCDGVQYTSSTRAGGSRSILVGSVNIISGDGEVKNKRQPLFVLRKTRLCQCGCSGFCTVQEIMRAFAWSMKCLADGVSPNCRHDGSPFRVEEQGRRLPPGTLIPKAALLQVRGDWEWLEQCFRLRSVSSDAFCWMCQATKNTTGPLHYHDFRVDAAHRTTLISHRDYIMACAAEGSQPSHLFRCPGTLLDHLTVDAMHACDLGTFQDAVGSLLWLEITHKGWYRSKVAGLAQLNQSLNNYYAANRHLGLSSITPLTQSQILAKSPGYPFLKAKAAQTRHLAQFCLVLAQRHRTGTADRAPFRFGAGHRLAAHTARHGGLLVELFEGFLGFTTSCSASPFQVIDCRVSMYKYLQALKGLHDLWRTDAPPAQHNRLPFHIRQKCHLAQHLVHEKIQAYGSPSDFWCYRDEDFVGVIKSIASKTKHPATLEQRLIEKLRIWAALE